MQVMLSPHVLLQTIERTEHLIILADAALVSQQLDELLLYVPSLKVNVVPRVQQIALLEKTKRLHLLGEHDLGQILPADRTLVLLQECSHAGAALVADRMLAHANAVILGVSVAHDARVVRAIAAAVVGRRHYCSADSGSDTEHLLRDLEDI